MSVAVTLSYDEGLRAALGGCMQAMRVTEMDLLNHDHGGASGRDMHTAWAHAIQGHLAEMAICKLLGIFPTAGIDGIRGGDPGGYAMRGTVWTDGKLIVNGNELPALADTPFILATGHWPTFEVQGWLYGWEAMRDEWWRADQRPPGWWVPQHALHPLATLPQPKANAHALAQA
jgi:hypothetical protein